MRGARTRKIYRERIQIMHPLQKKKKKFAAAQMTDYRLKNFCCVLNILI